MKKWIGAMFLMTLMQTAFAQDFKNVENSLILRNYESAKKEYEKVILKKPNLDTTAEGFYFKSRIYAGFAIDPDTSKNQSAYDKMIINLESYINKDQKFELASKKGVEPFFVVYAKSANLGEIAFNEKKWKSSALEFEKALYYSDIIYSNNWGEIKQPFDTLRLLFAGYSNQNAGNEDIAIKHYTRIIDANIIVDMDLYKYVIVKATDKKNKELFEKYYAKCLSNFPKEDWFEYRADYIDKTYSVEEKLTSYEAQINSNKITETECLMYGDMFMLAKNEEGISMDKANVFQDKSAEAYMKAYNLNNNNYKAAYLVGMSYYNKFIELDDEFRSNIKSLQQLNTNKPPAPKDVSKKTALDLKFKAQQDSIKKLNIALEVQMKPKVDQSIDWIEKSFNILKDKEITNLTKDEKKIAIRAVDNLAILYSIKRDKNRANEKIYDELDEKFKKYDLLHDKYQ
jgi:hypothetical protein